MQSLLVALVAPSAVLAEIEATIELRNETAAYAKSGSTIGQEKSMLDTGDHNNAGDLMKFQNQAKLFLNGDLGEDSSWHAELQIIYDPAAINDEGRNEGGTNYRGHKLYTQNDYFRELYVDTEVSDWSLRLGKQQVVWGTADGIKLLDIINPTDFRELNQNVMEDARIPIWMVNAERAIGDNNNLQLIVSQAEENKIPGLNPGGDDEQPFVMKGVDTITGQVNGFYNVAPALSNVAGSFTAAAFGGLFDVTGDGNGNPIASGLTSFGGLTVDLFASTLWEMNVGPDGIAMTADDSINQPATFGPGSADYQMPGDILLNNITQNGLFPGDPNGNDNETNLLNVTGAAPMDVVWKPGTKSSSSAFEYMANATFATFNTFSTFDPTSPTGFRGTDTEWVTKNPDTEDVNAGFRWKSNLDNGFNFSLNYFNHYGANPKLDLSWRAPNGEKLAVERAPTDLAGTPVLGVGLTRDQAKTNFDLGNPTTVLVKDGAGNYYGAIDPSTGNFGLGAPTLRFTESYYTVNSYGTSFDYAMNVGDTPLVLRGEFLYDEGEKQPVIDKFLLGIGDLTNALKMEDADYFKYVLGADITVMTNLLVSAQFIQFRNLDYKDDGGKCTTQVGNVVDCSRYTADFSTMSMSNNFQKAEENKEFVSLFLSKPFGEDQLGRWNNIVIWEENGGWWDRIDAEYSVTDQFIVNGEINVYWGDEDTTFGQFEDSSNVQVGFRYIFE